MCLHLCRTLKKQGGGQIFSNLNNLQSSIISGAWSIQFWKLNKDLRALHIMYLPIYLINEVKKWKYNLKSIYTV